MLGLSQTLVAGCVCWLVTSSLWIYPHSLSYFNESIGGPLNGPKHLLGSNVDWGQDLKYVKTFIQRRRPKSLHLAYFGSFDPRFIGLEQCKSVENRGATGNSMPNQAALAPGWHAVSESLIRDFGRTAYDGNAPASYALDRFAVKQLFALTSITGACAGYSIALFHIPENENARLTTRSVDDYALDLQRIDR